jgi:hypothetical protein
MSTKRRHGPLTPQILPLRERTTNLKPAEVSFWATELAKEVPINANSVVS